MFHLNASLAEAATAVQLERSWTEESPYNEEMELLRESEGMRLDIRQARKAGEAVDWAELLNSEKLKCLDESEGAGMWVRGEAIGRRLEEHCTADPAPQHGHLEADHHGSRKRRGGVTLSYVCPHCHRYPLEDYDW